jgi:ABC-type Fe3+ transport system substrate-binding protein
LIHPEVQDRSTGWLDVGSIWLGQKPGYVAATALRPRANLAEIYYNLNQVDPEELEGIRSWHNFLKPEWRGRIVCVLDPNSTTAGSDWRSAWVVLGNPWFERFMRELAPVLLPDSSHHELVHGVAKGKYDIALFASRAASLQFQKLARAGIPVRKLTRTLEEGNWASLSGAIGIFDNAPNPHAAQLFVNWYMSREGQTTLVNLILADDPYPSLRTDVPQGRVADYAWNIALNIDRSSIVRSDPEWDETTFEESSAVMKSLCARFGCYGY